MRRNAFTLIELLVVISILGILAALVFVSFSSSQKQARDTQRKSDLKQYSTSLESFASASNGMYPSWTNIVNASLGLCSALGLSACPEDPKLANDSTYQRYKYSSSGSGGGVAKAVKYVLWAKLEGSANYWVVCSTGVSSTKSKTGWANPSAGVCPL